MAMIARKCEEVQVTVVDINAERIAQWNSDELPIFEPGLQETVMAARGRNLFFSTSKFQNEIDSLLFYLIKILLLLPNPLFVLKTTDQF